MLAGRSGAVVWVDMLAGDVLRLSEDGSVDRWHVDPVAALVRPRVGEGLVVAGSGECSSRRPTARSRLAPYRCGLAGRRRFAAQDEPGVAPDGLCVDAEGGVWRALGRGGAVLRYDESEWLSERIDLPARQITSCKFGGPDLLDLFVTTSRLEDETGGSAPGSLFRVATGVVGLALASAAL